MIRQGGFVGSVHDRYIMHLAYEEPDHQLCKVQPSVFNGGREQWLGDSVKKESSRYTNRQEQITTHQVGPFSQIQNTKSKDRDLSLSLVFFFSKHEIHIFPRNGGPTMPCAFTDDLFYTMQVSPKLNNLIRAVQVVCQMN